MQPGRAPTSAEAQESLNTWVNKAAYAIAAPGNLRNLQRGSFTGPGLTNLDASLHKSFLMPYNEKHQLSIRFEAFNALNHPNWGTPNLNFSSSTFGRIGGAGCDAPIATRGEVPVLVRRKRNSVL